MISLLRVVCHRVLGTSLPSRPRGPAERSAARGWVQRGGATLNLTDAGMKGREDVFTRMSGVREASLRGVSAEDYAVVIRTLQKVVENLS